MDAGQVLGDISIGLIVMVMVIGLIARSPHLFVHQWGKWGDVEAEPGLTELYIVQERRCETCGFKEQRWDRRPIL